MGEIADKWGDALTKLKEAYRLPPLEAFSMGLQVEMIVLLEALRDDLARFSSMVVHGDHANAAIDTNSIPIPSVRPKTTNKPKVAAPKAGIKRGRPPKTTASPDS